MLGKIINPLTISLAAFLPLWAWHGGLAGLPSGTPGEGDLLPRRAQVTRGSLPRPNLAAEVGQPPRTNVPPAGGAETAPGLTTDPGLTTAPPMTAPSLAALPLAAWPVAATKKQATPAVGPGAAAERLASTEQQLEWLKQRGATYLRLDRGASEHEFHCYAELPVDPTVGRVRSFRARGDRPELAVGRVLAQVDAWSR